MNDGQVLIRLSELERKVSRLYEHLDIAEPQLGDRGLSPEVVQALREGNTIGAIKLYREQNDTDLAAAKAAVEAYWAQHGGG